MNCVDRHIGDSVFHAAGGKQLHLLQDRVHIHHEVYFAATLQPNLCEKAGQGVHTDPELAHIRNRCLLGKTLETPIDYRKGEAKSSRFRGAPIPGYQGQAPVMAAVRYPPAGNAPRATEGIGGQGAGTNKSATLARRAVNPYIFVFRF